VCFVASRTGYQRTGSAHLVDQEHTDYALETNLQPCNTGSGGSKWGQSGHAPLDPPVPSQYGITPRKLFHMPGNPSPKTLPPSRLELWPLKHILSEYWPIHVTATVTVSTAIFQMNLTGFPQFSAYTCGSTCSGREPVRKSGPFLRAGCPSCHLI